MLAAFTGLGYSIVEWEADFAVLRDEQHQGDPVFVLDLSWGSISDEEITRLCEARGVDPDAIFAALEEQ